MSDTKIKSSKLLENHPKLLGLSEKIFVPGFSPVVETLSLSEKIPVPGFFPVLETLSLSEKIPGTGALRR